MPAQAGGGGEGKEGSIVALTARRRALSLRRRWGPLAEAGDSAGPKAAKGEEATAMTPSRGRSPPLVRRGQEDDPAGEAKRAAGSAARLPGRERLKRLPCRAGSLGRV